MVAGTGQDGDGTELAPRGGREPGSVEQDDGLAVCRSCFEVVQVAALNLYVPRLDLLRNHDDRGHPPGSDCDDETGKPPPPPSVASDRLVSHITP